MKNTSKLIVDSLSVKINKIIVTILLTSISIGVLFLLSVFVLGKIIDNEYLVDQSISPLILLGIISSGIIVGVGIKETIFGKIFYAIITGLLTILPIFLVLILITITALSLSKEPW